MSTDLFGNPIPPAPITGAQGYLLDTRRNDAPIAESGKLAALRAASAKDAPVLLEAQRTYTTKWLDEHEGTVWKYAMLRRPAMCGFTCPREGYLLVGRDNVNAKHHEYPHGLIYYSRELTAHEVEAFELKPL